MMAFKENKKEHGIVSAAYGATALGNVRPMNEDRFLVDEDEGLFAVSDGMGGHSGGEVAAQLVVDALPEAVATVFAASAPMNEKATARLVLKAMVRVNERVRKTARETEGLADMGATAVVFLVRKGFGVIGHMGDSRAYLLRKGCLERLTRDQTLTELLVSLGRITRKASKKHFGRNSLTSYVGMAGEPEPGVGVLKPMPGDRVLLCTDGLTDELTDRQIGTLLWEKEGIQEAAERLVRAAVAAGGRDNVTAVVVQVGEYEKRLTRGKSGVVVRRAIGGSLEKE